MTTMSLLPLGLQGARATPIQQRGVTHETLTHRPSAWGSRAGDGIETELGTVPVSDLAIAAWGWPGRYFHRCI